MGFHLASPDSQSNTWLLLSASHLMFALVFSIACSRASEAEPNPTWRFCSLKRSSWRQRKNGTERERERGWIRHQIDIDGLMFSFL